MENWKGTKGNWRVRNEQGMLFVESPKEDLGTAYGQEIMGDDYHNEEEKIHDAHLIAAAPKMLEALQNLENDAGQIPESAWKLVKDAIKLAAL